MAKLVSFAGEAGQLLWLRWAGGWRFAAVGLIRQPGANLNQITRDIGVDTGVLACFDSAGGL
ncbi:MAG TPA: hypothetical protein VGV14_07715 [Rhodanobacter sp.]|nr:hypothetical protein [Rhodanobacter sp.]